MARQGAQDGERTLIKKYANRRLYNTGTSSYITLDDLAGMVRSGVDFQVLDAKTGDDITHTILTQIIMEAESGDKPMLPVSFLRDIISMYGGQMQSMMPTYLESSMKSFRENQDKLKQMFKDGMAGNPLAKIHENNMAMMRAATEAFLPGAKKSEPADDNASSDELAALREQMAAMQKKLDELGK